MKNYLELVSKIIDQGEKRLDRTGVGTYSLFGERLEFNLKDGFPLVTTKKVFFKGIVTELLWMLKGSTNIKFLKDNGVNIWNDWADEFGELGPVYGYQWRNFNGFGVDQIKNCIDQIKNKPHSRRIMVVTANPAQEHLMALPPCPSMFQFYVGENGLSMQVYQRSCDIFLGGPFDIASYALLLSMVAKVTGLEPYKLIYTFGDVHLYINHLDQAKEQLSRNTLILPKLELSNKDDIDSFSFNDIKLVGYESHPAIKAEIAV